MLYSLAIERLAKEGVPLPKMGMVKHNGEWFLVSQLFVKSGISKFIPWDTDTLDGANFCAKINAKIVNAGYYPSSDFFDLLATKGKKDSFPRDPDMIDLEGNLTLEQKIGSGIVLAQYYIKGAQQPLETFLAELKPKYRRIARQLIEKEKRQRNQK